ncbi:uncharacterized protein LOC111071861 [Drosophila obscura]|uniref:uncharacterized protein LOC111071861 n=1 Tax=Drosophila obscura TaxID=7282 RepID=UPI001BB29CCE|nr:uncharacterized protein LOC111071861 [Drosophila obscura]
MDPRTILLEAMKENAQNMRTEQDALLQIVPPAGDLNRQSLHRILQLNRQIVDTANSLIDTLRQIHDEPYVESVDNQMELALNVCNILIDAEPDEHVPNGLPGAQIEGIEDEVAVQNGLLAAQAARPEESLEHRAASGGEFPRFPELNVLGEAQIDGTEDEVAVQNGLVAAQAARPEESVPVQHGELSISPPGSQVGGTGGEFPQFSILNELGEAEDGQTGDGLVSSTESVQIVLAVHKIMELERVFLLRID